MRKNPAKNRRGFTLIEIIVSLGIFSVVAVVALGALVKIITANKKAQTIQAAVTNINFAIDSMSREIRVGRNHYCAVSGPTMDSAFTTGTLNSSTECASGLTDQNPGTVLAFVSSRVGGVPGNTCNLITAYLFFKETNGYSLNKAEQTTCNAASYEFSPVIDPNVTITSYYMRVVAPGTNPFPLTTIRISGYAGVLEKEKTYFDIQTALSARVQ